MLDSRDALIVALPPVVPPGAQGDAARIDWWRVVDGRIARHGGADEWPVAGADAAPVLALAPVADVALSRAAFPDLAPRQALAAARLLAAQVSATPADALHVAVGPADGEGRRMIAAVDHSAMTGWLGWCAARGFDPAAIIPAAMLVDPAGGDALVRATIGGETLLRDDTTAFPDEAMLVQALVAETRPVVDARPAAIEAAMVAACDTAPLDLRAGPYALRRAPWFDAALLRRAAMLAGGIAVVSLLIALAGILRAHADIARLDRDAAGRVARVLSPAPPLDRAVAALDARLAATGAGASRLSVPLAALVAAMDPAPGVTLDALAWRGDGTLAVTLGAPRADDINPVLIALQARGYVITARPRGGTDGRALGDITIRSSR